MPSVTDQILTEGCRYAKAVALKHGFAFEILDSGEGYLFAISSDSQSFVVGAGPLSSYPINSAFGSSVANDKIFTNKLLDRAEIPNLGGRVFFLTPESRQLRGKGYERSDAFECFKSLNEFAFCKPLKGSRGDFAELVKGEEAFVDYLNRCSQRHHAIVIQPYFRGIERRVFVLDGQPVFCIEKQAVEIVGDGNKNVAALLDLFNEKLVGTGVSLYPPMSPVLRADGCFVLPSFLPRNGERLVLCGRKNLSYSRTPILLDPIPKQVGEISVRAAKALDLRAAAVDCIECDPTVETGGDAGSDSVRVIEVNANPSISSLERLNRWDLIEHIWLHIIRTCLR